MNIQMNSKGFQENQQILLEFFLNVCPFEIHFAIQLLLCFAS